VKFFFDNNLALKIAKGLNGFVAPDHKVVHLRELFEGDVDDVEWMRGLAKGDNWIIVTADVNIGKNPHEIAAWKEAGHTIFFLKRGWLNLSFWEQAHKFTKCFPQIIEKATSARRGSSFIVSVNGKIDG
jgi:predicted nuclease of predicted toxin-antitoxin system